MITNEENYVTLQSHQPKTFEIIINLAPYVHAFETRDDGEYQRIKNILQNKVGASLMGDLTFLEGFDLAMAHSSDDEKEQIQQSPAIEILKQNFVEILKNTMDVIIEGYFEKNLPLQGQLCVSIHLNEHQISIDITDTGPGFPGEFLEQVGSKNNQNEYCEHNTSSSSERKKGFKETRPALFGGRSIGLRRLISDVNGEIYDAHRNIRRYESSECSRIKFDNHEGGGARINITTALAKRRDLIQEITTPPRLTRNSSKGLSLTIEPNNSPFFNRSRKTSEKNRVETLKKREDHPGKRSPYSPGG